MSDLRFLAPRPPGEATPRGESATATRKSKVAIACESCRLKRIKVGIPFTVLLAVGPDANAASATVLSRNAALALRARLSARMQRPPRSCLCGSRRQQ
jgi:hypothetical protein